MQRERLAEVTSGCDALVPDSSLPLEQQTDVILVGGGKHVLYLGNHSVRIDLLRERGLLDGGAARHVRGQTGALARQRRGHFLRKEEWEVS